MKARRAVLWSIGGLAATGAGLGTYAFGVEPFLRLVVQRHRVTPGTSAVADRGNLTGAALQPRAEPAVDAALSATGVSVGAGVSVGGTVGATVGRGSSVCRTDKSVLGLRC